MFTKGRHRNKLSGLAGNSITPRYKPCIALLVVALAMAACSLQSDYTAPPPIIPRKWSVENQDSSAGAPSDSRWWLALHDPAMDALVSATFANNPTLDKAVAQIDEARAQRGVARADYYPSITTSGKISQANSQINSGGGSGAGAEAAAGVVVGDSRTSSIGPALSWELDLWGRIRASVDAAQQRLDARTADAQNTKLSLAVQVANTVLDWRGCTHTARVDADDITSRQKTLELVQKKTAAGFMAEVDTASVTRDLAAAQGTLATQQARCTRDVNALVALSGRDQDAVMAVLAQPLLAVHGKEHAEKDSAASFMPTPPPMLLQLPATILLNHPSVVAADRDAAAAWADTGVARANRLPQINLSAALTYEWIRAAGSALSLTSWSLGPGLNATVFDAGKGAATVDAYKARYAQAAATLQATLRSTVKEVENALVAEQSAALRIKSSQRALLAAKIAFRATQAQWKNGMTSLLELEDARRQYAAAQDSFITAACDRATAWVGLVNATANALTLTQSQPQ